ncbi:MAG: EAL domain-containing protein [Planctomycetota bacterium]
MTSDPGETFYLGRQPIYDRQLEVRAYEILFRDGRRNRARVDPEGADQASARVIADTFVELGIEAVTDSRPAFVNLTRRLLFSDIEALFPPGNFYLEVLEDIEPDEALARRLSELKASGYRIVLDDFRYSPRHEPLVAIADIVKIDVMDFRDLEELDAELELIARPGLVLLAEKIESAELFEACLERGFELFQGFVLGRPVVLEGRRLPMPRRSLLQLLARVNESEADWHEIVALVQAEVGIAYRVMRFVSASLGAGSTKVADLGAALLRLGRARLTAWINLALLSELAPSNDDARRRAVVIARMTEAVARRLGEPDPRSFYTAGLFCGLEDVLGRPMAEILDGLRLGPEVEAALTRRAGRMGDVLLAVRAYEQGDLDRIASLGIALPDLREAWLDALAHARDAVELGI